MLNSINPGGELNRSMNGQKNLRIKSFYGTFENAVKSQIWIAIAIYVLVTIVKKKLNLDISLYIFLKILSINMFEKIPILQLVTDNNYIKYDTNSSNQLNLFD